MLESGDRQKASGGHREVYDPDEAGGVEPAPDPLGRTGPAWLLLDGDMHTPGAPEKVAKPLYTTEEAVAAFRFATTSDAGVDPATVHYDWKEFGMDAWQSPVRPNLRTGLITDRRNGEIPPLTPEAQKRRADAAAQRRQETPRPVSRSLETCTRCVLGGGAAPLIDGGERIRFGGGCGRRVTGSDPPDSGPRGDRSAEKHRRADHSAGWASASPGSRPSVVRQLTWPVGEHPCR